MNLIKYLSIGDRHVKQYIDKQLAPYGLNSSQFIFVGKICREPGMTQDKFFKYFFLHPSNITRGLAALEREGFIERREHSADKRTTVLYPTPRAEAVYQHVQAMIERLHAVLTEGMSEAEAETLDRLLAKAVDNILKANGEKGL